MKIPILIAATALIAAPAFAEIDEERCLASPSYAENALNTTIAIYDICAEEISRGSREGTSCKATNKGYKVEMAFKCYFNASRLGPAADDATTKANFVAIWGRLEAAIDRTFDAARAMPPAPPQPRRSFGRFPGR